MKAGRTGCDEASAETERVVTGCAQKEIKTLPLQPLPLEEPVVVHAVEVVSEGRHAQVVVNQSGGETRENTESDELINATPEETTATPVIHQTINQIRRRRLSVC